MDIRAYCKQATAPHTNRLNCINNSQEKTKTTSKLSTSTYYLSKSFAIIITQIPTASGADHTALFNAFDFDESETDTDSLMKKIIKELLN